MYKAYLITNVCTVIKCLKGTHLINKQETSSIHKTNLNNLSKTHTCTDVKT